MNIGKRLLEQEANYIVYPPYNQKSIDQKAYTGTPVSCKTKSQSERDINDHSTHHRNDGSKGGKYSIKKCSLYTKKDVAEIGESSLNNGDQRYPHSVSRNDTLRLEYQDAFIFFCKGE